MTKYLCIPLWSRIVTTLILMMLIPAIIIAMFFPMLQSLGGTNGAVHNLTTELLLFLSRPGVVTGIGVICLLSLVTNICCFARQRSGRLASSVLLVLNLVLFLTACMETIAAWGYFTLFHTGTPGV